MFDMSGYRPYLLFIRPSNLSLNLFRVSSPKLIKSCWMFLKRVALWFNKETPIT